MEKNKSIFITGVDTNVGKTFVSIGLCLAAKNKGLKVGYYKPFQSGAYKENNEKIAPDIHELKKYDTKIDSKYSYLFKGEVSPHLATILEEKEVDINKIKKDFINFSSDKDYTVIEGAGGLYCPAYKGNLFSDIIKNLSQEIIIVTTPSLGRLNHTLMTIECAKMQNIKIKGLIINQMPNNPTKSEEYFIKELKMFTDCKILSIIPKISTPTKDKIIKYFTQS